MRVYVYVTFMTRITPATEAIAAALRAHGVLAPDTEGVPSLRTPLEAYAANLAQLCGLCDEHLEAFAAVLHSLRHRASVPAGIEPADVAGQVVHAWAAASQLHAEGALRLARLIDEGIDAASAAMLVRGAA